VRKVFFGVEVDVEGRPTLDTRRGRGRGDDRGRVMEKGMWRSVNFLGGWSRVNEFVEIGGCGGLRIGCYPRS
jgi:hypothetical protein